MTSLSLRHRTRLQNDVTKSWLLPPPPPSHPQSEFLATSAIVSKYYFVQYSLLFC